MSSQAAPGDVGSRNEDGSGTPSVRSLPAAFNRRERLALEMASGKLGADSSLKLASQANSVSSRVESSRIAAINLRVQASRGAGQNNGG